MRSNRHILRREWEDVRADIERVIREEQLAPSDFRPLGIHDGWPAIEEKIYQVFCRLTSPASKPRWLWNAFKQHTESFSPGRPWQYLPELIDPAETVWFFTSGSQDKLWFYQGTVGAIVKVIEETYFIDALYLASKKYEWLICIEHHDVLIATGGTMPERLRQLKAAAH